MSRLDRAVSEATRAVNQAIRDGYAQRRFHIIRFGRHREGYLHAQVTLDAAPIYVCRRYGSWQIPPEPQAPDCPLQFAGQSWKEVVPPYTYALAEEAQRYELAERRRTEAADAVADHGRPRQQRGRVAEAA